MIISDFIKFLETERDSCLAQADTLVDDDRRDEANMLKVRSNIFDLFAVISKTAKKHAPQNQINFIKEKIETIPKAWEASLAVAKEQNFHEKIAIEHIKLEAMTQINYKFNDVSDID